MEKPTSAYGLSPLDQIRLVEGETAPADRLRV